MEQPVIHYEFINSQTENVMGYLSLPADMEKNMQIEQLKKKQAEIAISNNLNISRIYWNEQRE